MFRRHVKDAVAREHPDKNSAELSKVIGEMWRNLNEEQKNPYREQARMEREAHKKLFPKYKFCPKKRKTVKNSRRSDEYHSNFDHHVPQAILNVPQYQQASAIIPQRSISSNLDIMNATDRQSSILENCSVSPVSAASSSFSTMLHAETHAMQSIKDRDDCFMDNRGFVAQPIQQLQSVHNGVFYVTYPSSQYVQYAQLRPENNPHGIELHDIAQQPRHLMNRVPISDLVHRPTASRDGNQRVRAEHSKSVRLSNGKHGINEIVNGHFVNATHIGALSNGSMSNNEICLVNVNMMKYNGRMENTRRTLM